MGRLVKLTTAPLFALLLLLMCITNTIARINADPLSETYFQRIATFPVCQQMSLSCNDDVQTTANSVTVSADGMTLIYADSSRGVVGLVDITDPSNPRGSGFITLGLLNDNFLREMLKLLAVFR